MKDETMLGSKEVAELLGINITTLYRRIKGNRFISPKKDRFGYFYWNKDDVYKYMMEK